MNPFTLDFSKYYDDILSSFKTIFGYEYSSVIDERLGNLLLTTYSNYEGIKEYYDFLEDAKSRELCIKFLNIIGVGDFNITCYADKFDGELENIINMYLDGEYAFKSAFQVIPDTFRAFLSDESNMCTKNTIINNRIKFINNITKRNITKDIYDEFINCDEYKELIILIKKYNEIYINLCDEMNTYMESISEYKKHYISEQRRYNEIIDLKINELYENIKDYFSYDIKDELNDRGLDNKLFIEYFSKENVDKLKDSKVSIDEKNRIISYRERYLSNLGKNKEVPSFDIVDKITKMREEKKEEVIRKFIYESDTFKLAISNFADNDASKEYMYRMIKNRRVCVHAGVFNGKFIPLMFLTLRSGECGTLDYIVLHEMIHALESEEIEGDNYRCGFEPKIFYGESSPHIYKHPKRKYERLNETVTDLFALEALEVLHTLGIYFMDDKERTKLSPGNNNTSIILKTILKPFMERYRDLIIDARICGSMDNLKNYVGSDNFEELNDIIDYIDMLVEMGLSLKLKEKNMDDVLVCEYINELKKLSNVYTNMDEHYKEQVTKTKIK